MDENVGESGRKAQVNNLIIKVIYLHFLFDGSRLMERKINEEEHHYSVKQPHPSEG